MTTEKQKILTRLKRQLLEAQESNPTLIAPGDGFGLGPLEACFPFKVFPTGTIHEFLAENPENIAASEGFMAGLMAKLMETGNPCLWISRNRKLFPPALQGFGVWPQQVIFIDLYREKEILWVMEEALKCEGLAVVVAELPDIDFAQSRRLQLVVEKSRVTGFLLRKEPKRLSATACTVRWSIKPQPSELQSGLPGVGQPRWEVNLLKVRNGHTGSFLLEWAADHFKFFETTTAIDSAHSKQAG
ncbi:Error-prone repair protein ImuA [Pedobacter frigiditerrae]|uniref:Error-prone repair protein ImuA n=1 Tax=Pedobacter frigiditerrae TaxID=2530452 RepID=A0A4R0MSW0_9SPHI|nr:Error-prone repair protein ImuA [Pedobacter frigiditerrae]TCC90111.1 Error-prone repair protein ImuA [Pedobacter frigiditerrae]